jgi:hypothetical protein
MTMKKRILYSVANYENIVRKNGYYERLFASTYIDQNPTPLHEPIPLF